MGRRNAGDVVAVLRIGRRNAGDVDCTGANGSPQAAGVNLHGCKWVAVEGPAHLGRNSQTEQARERCVTTQSITACLHEYLRDRRSIDGCVEPAFERFTLIARFNAGDVFA